MHSPSWTLPFEKLPHTSGQKLTPGPIKSRENKDHKILFKSDLLFIIWKVGFKIWRPNANFCGQCLCESPFVDAQKRSHYQPNAAVWDENGPEELFEKFQVSFALDDKPPVGKADEHASENEAEQSRVGKHHVQRKMSDVEVLAPKDFVTLRRWNHQETETVHWADNSCWKKDY